MGDITGFLKFAAAAAAAAAGAGAPARLEGGLRALPGRGGPPAGGPVHGLRDPLLPRGLPAGQPDPRVERPGLPRRLVRGHRAAPRHQQLPRVHRPAVPGPVRGACVLGINDDPVTIERIEYEIVERAWSEGWVRAGAVRRPPPASGWPWWVGPGRPGRRPAAGPGRSPGGGVRAGREARRTAALRHPRVQDGEGGPRPPPRPDGGRGGRVPVPGLGGGAPPPRWPGRRPPTPPWSAPARWSTSSTAWCWPAGPPCPATCPSPDGSWTGSTWPWST